MNKSIFVLFVLFFSSCSTLNKKNILSKNDAETIIIYANIELQAPHSFNHSKFKTKITFYPDTIIASIYPFLGLELARLTITNNYIHVQNRIKNTTDTIRDFEISSKFKIKKLQRSIIQMNNKKDTIEYNNSGIRGSFTNYTPLKLSLIPTPIFVPKKITLEAKNNFKLIPKIQMNIDYKSVKMHSLSE